MILEHEVTPARTRFLAGINTAERGLSREEDEERSKRVSDINVLVSKQTITFDFPKVSVKLCLSKY